MLKTINHIDKEHDFQLLRWWCKHLENSDELLHKLKFDDYKSFLYRLVDQFTDGDRQFDCSWACCRTLLPEFVVVSQTSAGIIFNDIIQEKRDSYNQSQKDNLTSNYKCYFFERYGEHKPARIDMWREFKSLSK
jgi:hypothetical protein